MFVRWLLVGTVVLGAVGQLRCAPAAEAAEESTSSALNNDKKGDDPEGGQFCGGFAAIQCPEGLICVDDPNDSCDPHQGADCGGICVDPEDDQKPKCNYNDPNRRYVSRDPDQCAAIRFVCNEGETAFFDNCGCGCELTPAP